jgi:hypothetical protein
MFLLFVSIGLALSSEPRSKRSLDEMNHDPDTFTADKKIQVGVEECFRDDDPCPVVIDPHPLWTITQRQIEEVQASLSVDECCPPRLDGNSEESTLGVLLPQTSMPIATSGESVVLEVKRVPGSIFSAEESSKLISPIKRLGLPPRISDEILVAKYTNDCKYRLNESNSDANHQIETEYVYLRALRNSEVSVKARYLS